VRMFQSTIGKAEGEPWCMSFIQYCLFWVDEFVPGRAHTVYPSEWCKAVWDKAGHARRAQPQKGYVVIYNYVGTDSGHAGIVEAHGFDGQHEQEPYIITIEANTSDSERSVIREGDGVYRKKRLTRRSGRMRLLGFIDPWG